MNFKLYKDLGLQYPPKDIKGVSTSLQEEGAQPFLHSD